jgi:hypothetical protein
MAMGDSVNVNSLDSLVLKAADVDKRKYLNTDFAMGGLDLQETIPVMTLNEAGDVVVDQPIVKPPKRSNQSKHRAAADNIKRSKALKMLRTIKHDLSQHRTSKLRDKDVSYTESLSFIIDDWQSSENVQSPGIYRKQQKNRIQSSPNVVNLDQLLMDDTGMSFEEAKCLVEEYSGSLNI